MSRIIIFGGGWSGLLASIKVKSLYPRSEVICIDKSFDGGLLRSEIIDGHLFDTGGSHVVFSKNQKVISSMLSMGNKWVKRKRAAYILLNNHFVPYPFENGIYLLPPERRVRYGISLINALIKHYNKKPKNLKEWILNMFGKEIANDYLIPYNKKVWKRPLNELSADWVYIPGRLPLPPIEDIVKAIAGIPTIGYGEQAYFYYPKRGGIIKLWESAYKRAKTLGVKFFKAEVKKVKKVSNEYIVNDQIKADKIITTLPLNESPSIFNLPEEAFKAGKRLEYNSVVVVGLGIKSPAPKQHWIYVPDKKIVFHRYAWISNYGEDTPPNKSTLTAEVTFPGGKKVDLNKIKFKVINGLIDLNTIKEKDIEIVKTWVHKYGYPVYTLTYTQDTAVIEKALTDIGVITFGRWGNWQYWNTDKIYEYSNNLVSYL